jgi:ABC-type sugar transport system substrate-binding protein
MKPKTVFRAVSLVILAVVVVSLLAGVFSLTTAQAQGGAWPLVNAKKAKIGYSIQLGHPYSTAMVDLLKKEGALYGFTIDVFDMKGDIPTQIAQVEDMIAKKYDVIILAPYDAAALVPAVKKASDAGIPVINSQNPLNDEGMKYVQTYIGSSGVLEGKAAGALICKFFGGKDGNWVEVEGAPGHPLVPQRGGEAEKWVAQNCPNAKLLAKDTGQWDRAKTRTVMENFLTAYPGKINLVYCHDGNMCFGAVDAIKEAGLTDKIKAIGINGNKDEYDAIKAGTFYGTVLNSADFIAVNDIQRARDILESRPILKEYISPALGITKDNVANFVAYW